MAAKNKTNPRPAGKSNSPAQAAARPKAPKIPAGPGFWRLYWLPSLILMALSFALYGASIGYGYLLDDQMVIWENQYVQQGFAGLRKIFAYDSFMGYFKEQKFLLEGGRYRPLSLATFAMEVGLFGKDKPAIGHFFNILLYGLTAIVLFRVLLRLFPIQEGGRWYFSLAFIASLLFVVHPLHVECVANIKGRDEILALLGSLYALYAAFKYIDRQNAGWLLVSGISLLLAMLAKENALTFVAVIPFTVWFFGQESRGKALNTFWPLLLAALVFIVIRYKALGYMLNHGKSMNDLMNNPFLEMTGGEKTATIFMTLGWYLKLLFVPHPLTHDYYPYHVPKVGWGDWRALVSLAVYAGMGAWAVWQVNKRKVPAYTIIYWIITLSIVSNLFVSVGTFMNERFIYMPSVGFAILIAWFLSRQLPVWIKEKADGFNFVGGLALIGILGIFAALTVFRVPVWKDELSLNEAAIKVSPNSARSHCFYVTSIYKEKYQKEKNITIKAPLVDTMEYHIKRSLEIYPNYSSALIMKAAVAAGRFELDNQLDKLFHEFEYVLEKIPYNTNVRTFVDQYLDYLNGSNADKYMAFCYRVGYDFYFKKMKDPKTGLHFIEYALKRQMSDIRTFESAAEIYKALGDTARAAQMEQAAAAARR